MRSMLRGSGVLLMTAAVVACGWWASGQNPEAPSPSNRPEAVTEFGAKGDGQTDDTAAIQRAVNDARGGVWFPKGTYRLTRPIVIDLERLGFRSLMGDGTATILMAGPGPAFRFVGTHEGSANPRTVKDNVWQRQRMPCVDGLEILGDHPEAVGIEATGTVQLTVTRVAIRKALHGIHLTGRNRNIILSNCHIYENRGAGVFYDHVNLHQSNIVGCHISYNAGGGVVCRGGDVRNIHIGTCDIEANQSPEGEPTANVLIDCSGGTNGIGEVAITGCTIQHGHEAPGSANIRILGRSGTGPDGRPVREGNITIADNVLSDVQVNVHLRDCRGVTIVGNTWWMGYEHNLLVADCTDLVIGPNNFDRNPRYRHGNSEKAANAIVFRNCADCTLQGLHIHGVRHSPAGLLIEQCRRFNVTGCTILDCDGVGLCLSAVSGSRVSDCLIDHNEADPDEYVALRVIGGNGLQIVDNLLGGRQEIPVAGASQ